MKKDKRVKLEQFKEKSSKKDILENLKLKNLKGGNHNCPPPFETNKKKE